MFKSSSQSKRIFHLPLLLAAALGAFAFSNPIEAAPTCSSLFDFQSSNSRVVRVSESIRTQFAKTKSYAIVPFSEFFPDEASTEIFTSILENRESIREREKTLDTTNYKGDGNINDLRSLEAQHRRRLERLIRLTDRALQVALPDLVQDLKDRTNQLRWSHRDVLGMLVEAWHPDGEPLVLIFVFKGEGTELHLPANHDYRSLPARHVPPDSIVPEGHVLIFAGIQSIPKGWRPLIHRSPLITRDRLILVRRLRFR